MCSSVKNFVDSLNNCWIDLNCENIESYFDQNIVMTSPDLSTSIKGMDAIADSYRSFVSAAEIGEFKIISEQEVSLKSNSIFVYDFRIKYMMNEKKYDETGRETLLIDTSSPNYKVLWRGIAFN